VLGKRVGKLWGYVYDPDQIKKFTGFRFYPFNPQAIIKGVYTQRGRQVVSYKTVQGDLTEVAKVGEVKFEWEGKSYALNAYNWQKPGEPLEYIALIFVEPTAGQETYAGGRELVIDITNGKVKKQFVTLDFNRTTNFYCAHSPFWHCPTGLQQTLDVATKAGEMLPLKKIVSRKAL
ncbi:MAG: DUF1684 domain-containing protein, partial [Bdellovibrionales bacterium]|nr:DUF1684 domain-containing protein [Bdellovibrionales bacterium]